MFNLYIKKQYKIIFKKVLFLLLALSFTSCSTIYEEKNAIEKKYNNFNREIINNYTKAISKNPDNFFFYLERGKVKQDFGDFKGAIDDFNNAFRINPDKRFLLYRANAKFDFGDYDGAIKDYKNLISMKYDANPLD